MEAEAGVCYISELPDELLLDITSRLQVERGFLADEEAEERRRLDNAILVRSLYALALTCRRFNALATPLLYQCVIAVSRPLFMPVLLCTLLRKPYLRDYIQYLEFAAFDYPEPTESLPLAQSDIEKLATRIVATTWLSPSPATTGDILNKGNDIPWILREHGMACSEVYPMLYAAMQCLWKFTYFSAFAALLSMLDSIQDIAIPDTMNALSILAFREWHRPGIFKRLWLKDSSSSSSRHPLRTLFSKPMQQNGHLAHYIRSLVLYGTRCLEFEPPVAMKSVSLMVRDVSSESLDTHLSGCDSLESFNLRWQWTDKFLPRNKVNLPALHKSLQRVQRTLTNLTIDTSESAWRVDMNQVIPALGSLCDFEVLVYLDVAGLVLWGDDDTSESPPLSELLPTSLQTLIIKTEWDDDVEDALNQLSLDCKSSLHSLGRVECNWRPAPRFEAEYLTHACKSAGIDLVLDIEDA